MFVDNIVTEQLLTSTGTRKVPNVQATAATTTSLTSASNSLQMFTGSVSGQIIRLPDATTLGIGWEVRITNSSTTIITVQDSAGGAIGSISASNAMLCYLQAQPNAAGTWFINITGSTTATINYIPASNLTQFVNAISSLNTLGGGTVHLTGTISLAADLPINMTNVIIKSDASTGNAINMNGYKLVVSGTGALFDHVRFLGTNGSPGSVTNTIVSLDPTTPPLWVWFIGCMFKNVYGSVPYSITYGFTIPSSTVGAGAVYTAVSGPSTYTYTVTTGISPGTTLTTTGNGTPPTTGTLTKVSGTGPATINYTATANAVGAGIAFDFRNKSSDSCEVVFSDCDMDSNWVAYPGGFGTGLTVWFAQTGGFDYHVKVIGCLESIQGRDRWIIVPPYGVANANNTIFFETDGTGRHYGPLPGAGNSTQSISLLPLSKSDSRSRLVDVPTASTLSLEPNFSGLYWVGEGLIRVTATSANQTITLPAVSYASTGFSLDFYKTGTYSMTLNANAGQTINGGSSYVVSGSGAFTRIYYDGNAANWIVSDLESQEPVQTVTSSTSITAATTNTVVNSATATTISLPQVSGLLTTLGGVTYSQPYTISNWGFGLVTVSAFSGDTIYGAATVQVKSKASITLLPCSLGWVIQ